ncbi:MAG: MFS transporter [Ilumatobacteraceae bacterium]
MTTTPATPPLPDTVVADAPSNRLGASYYKLFTGTVVSNLGDGIGTIAYPWLASAVTRNPILVALVAVAQRLPWLLFTLPAGVITDRVDRRRAMVSMDVLRGILTLFVAFAVLRDQGALPGPDELDLVTGTNTGLFLIVLSATLMLGMAEVLRDNANQTIMPNIVRPDQLEKANGRVWSIEGIMNLFVGPPLGSLLILVAFSLPFFVDSATFFVAAAMVFLIPGSFRAEREPDEQPQSFRQELGEGVRWLMGHSLLRPMAIILGLMNGASMITGSVMVLFAQEVLGIGPFLFTVMFFGMAIGGFVGGNVASTISTRLGRGTCLALTLLGTAAASLLIFVLPYWPVVMVTMGLVALLGILWNVITVSLRQTIIPPRLLGRVNSVYRFFAWGMMPIGAAVGGVLVWVPRAERRARLGPAFDLAGAGRHLSRPLPVRPGQADDRQTQKPPAGPPPPEPLSAEPATTRRCSPRSVERGGRERDDERSGDRAREVSVDEGRHVVDESAPVPLVHHPTTRVRQHQLLVLRSRVRLIPIPSANGHIVESGVVAEHLPDHRVDSVTGRSRRTGVPLPVPLVDRLTCGEEAVVVGRLDLDEIDDRDHATGSQDRRRAIGLCLGRDPVVRRRREHRVG